LADAGPYSGKRQSFLKVVFSDGEENEIGMDDPSDPPGSGHPGSGIGSGRRRIDPRKPIHLQSGDHPDSDSSSGKAVSIFEESALRFRETSGDYLLCSVTVFLLVYLLLYLSEYHLLQLVSVCLFLYLSDSSMSVVVAGIVLLGIGMFASTFSFFSQV
jgi:hypothetical protein